MVEQVLFADTDVIDADMAREFADDTAELILRGIAAPEAATP